MKKNNGGCAGCGCAIVLGIAAAIAFGLALQDGSPIDRLFRDSGSEPERWTAEDQRQLEELVAKGPLPLPRPSDLGTPSESDQIELRKLFGSLDRIRKQPDWDLMGLAEAGAGGAWSAQLAELENRTTDLTVKEGCVFLRQLAAAFVGNGRRDDEEISKLRELVLFPFGK